MERGEYLERLQEAIEKTHGLKSTHLEKVSVKETFQGLMVWEGEVEIFSIAHPGASQCYAWGFEEGGKLQCVAVLGVKPINSPQDAIKAYILSQKKR